MFAVAHNGRTRKPGYNMTEMFSQEDFTIGQESRKENMGRTGYHEGEKINRYHLPTTMIRPGTKGKRVGTAYESLEVET